MTTNLIRDSEKKIIGFMAIARDITERKQVEERWAAALILSSIGELADGVLLNWTSADYLQQAIRQIGKGAAKTGRDHHETGPSPEC